jgi:hypothetical protein
MSPRLRQVPDACVWRLTILALSSPRNTFVEVHRAVTTEDEQRFLTRRCDECAGSRTRFDRSNLVLSENVDVHGSGVLPGSTTLPERASD